MRFGNVTEGFISAPSEPQKFAGTFYAVRIEDENACCLATTEHTGTKLLGISMGFDEDLSLREKVWPATNKKKNSRSNLLSPGRTAGHFQWLKEPLRAPCKEHAPGNRRAGAWHAVEN